MNTKEIVLTNGETLSVKINFYTQFLLVENKVIELSEQIKEDPDNVLLNMKMAGKMIYVLLKSNGKAVTEEEALMLAPFDTDEIEELFKQFEERIEEFKKKQESKKQLQQMLNGKN